MFSVMLISLVCITSLMFIIKSLDDAEIRGFKYGIAITIVVEVILSLIYLKIKYGKTNNKLSVSIGNMSWTILVS